MSVGHLHVSFGEMSVHFSAHFLMGVFGFLGGVSVLFIFWILTIGYVICSYSFIFCVWVFFAAIVIFNIFVLSLF